MSAYMHDPGHIDALVHAGLTLPREVARPGWATPGANPSDWRRLSYENATEVGKMLLRENAESVAYRYNMKDLDNDADDGTRPIEYAGYLVLADEYEYIPELLRRRQGMPPRPTFTPVQILLAIQGYEYQSCVHPEWKDSAARAFCDGLRRAMIGILPGFEAAETWSITYPTAQDRMIGKHFTRDGAEFRVMREYMPGVYECRSGSGEVVLPVEDIERYIAEGGTR